MNTNPKNNDSLSLNFNVGGNSPPANLRYNGSPLAAFKMVKTFCVPSISRLLTRTGEFHHHTQKRYDDTGLLIAEILQWGYESERGAEAIAGFRL
ncbi:hypothetical protein [Coleofasciculus chthonoplastes]|nr:hypothetical protein [Coleofasciculus chthonoplastes]